MALNVRYVVQFVHGKKSNGRFEFIDCHKETTVTNGTIFHKSTKPLLVWFHAIWWMVAQKNGIIAKGLQKIFWIRSISDSLDLAS
jgi:hypothetical protein